VTEWLSKAIEALKLPLRYVWAIVIASGLLLFLPQNTLKRLHAEKFVQDFGSYIGLAFLVFGTVLVIQLVSALYSKIRAWMARNKRLSNALEELFHLDPSEKSVLREFFIQNQNTLQLPVDQATVSGLITKGVLTVAGSTGERSLAGLLFPVRIADHIRGTEISG
jgi:Super-infection exclusion protein B